MLNEVEETLQGIERERAEHMESKMGSTKPSVRSRSVNANSQLSSVPLFGNGNSVLSEKLAVFERESFDADFYVQTKCQSMNEKAIRNLCVELLDLKKVSAEEMRRSVYSNYPEFIRTSREISALETELLSMRSLLSTQASLINGIAQEVQLPSLVNGDTVEVSQENVELEDDAPLSSVEKRAQVLPDSLDIFLAERNLNEALVALEEGEKLIAKNRGKQILRPAIANHLQISLAEHKRRLADQLAKDVQQPSISRTELQSAILALEKLGDRSRAHTLLLNSHHNRLKYETRDLRPNSSSYGGAYTVALSQLVFSRISQAAEDSVTVFREDPSLVSELVIWARSETEEFVSLLQKHVLSSSAAAGSLRAVSECVQIALGHCVLLEKQGLSLCPVLSKLVKPSIDQALEENVRHIEDSVRVLAAADSWELSYSPAVRSSARTAHAASAGLSSQLKLSISAHRFSCMVQDLIDDVVLLPGRQLVGPTLDRLGHLFETYIDLSIKALPTPIEDEAIESADARLMRIAETEAQQLAILGNAAALADEVLPRATLKLVPGHHLSKDELRKGGKRSIEKQVDGAFRLPEQRDWRRRLQRGVDKLRGHFCRQHALDLIYSEDGEPQLSLEMYLHLDVSGNGSYKQQEPMPSLFFQALFEKLNSIAEEAAEVLPGRERVVTLLLMRLLETIVLWLCDQDFWEDIEDSPRPFGTKGLIQFLLDMHFIIHVASQGHYYSRNMRQNIADVISRAINAFAATGIDPNSVLPEDDWFTATAQDTLRRLLVGWSRSSPNDGGVNSSTTSTQSL